MLQSHLSLSISIPKPTFDPRTALQKISNYGDWVGLRVVSETTHARGARDGRPEDNHVTFDRGAMVEVMIGGQIAYGATCDLSLSGIEKAARHAQALAKAGMGYKVYDFSEKQRPTSQGKYFSPRQKDLSLQSLAELSERLRKSTEIMKVSPKISSSMADAMIIEAEHDYLTSNGTDIHQNFLMLSSHFGVIANDGLDSQTRSLDGPRGATRQAGFELFDLHGLEDQLVRVGEEAVALLSAPNCPTQTTDLVLSPSQMLIQIHESIGHPLEMDRILGDERNFAGWSFVKPQDFGHLQYGSPLMNVTFDPTVAGQFASYSFDDGGAPATREFLIKDGMLMRGLGGLESQARLGQPGVANFRAASWNRAPIDRMANINLEPGQTPLNEMIAKVENGVFMDANVSWSIDDYRDKFQFGCEVGRIIKDGELKEMVKNPNYRGRTVPFWRNLKAVGTADEVGVFGTPYCGKGEPSQVIRVGHASPPCLFEKIEVFGGGK